MMHEELNQERRELRSPFVHRRFRAVLTFLRSEDGPTAVEYAVMLALIVGACVATVKVMSNATADSFTNTASQLSDAFGGGS